MNFMTLFLFTLSLLPYVYAINKQLEDDMKKYLAKYGYISLYDVGNMDEQAFKETVQRFQYFANLPQTGTVDVATSKQILMPRCGLKDPKLQIKRVRRYVHQGSKWFKSVLTWHLKDRGRTLDRETTRKIILKAMRLWSMHTNIDFKEISGNNPDIWIKFAKRYHHDPYTFDGRGGTLAHAFYPHNGLGLSGDIHFDDEEKYTYQSQEGKNLLWVVTHELGHSLGLEHSNVQESVMYPWHKKYKPEFKLPTDDILGIQYLYGRRIMPYPTKVTSTTTQRLTNKITKVPTLKPKYKPCPVSTIAAVYYNTYARLQVVMTQDKMLYFVKSDGTIRYGPVNTVNYVPHITKQIDAAFNTQNIGGKDKTIFFVGNKYYVYRHFGKVSGPHYIFATRYKSPLQLRFPRWVRKIDAVMAWHRNKRTYFFSGIYYWRYDNDLKRFDKGYPKITQKGWPGLPKHIDSAFSSHIDKRTFFISGNQFYSFNDYYVHVKKSYPKPIGHNWLKCGNFTPNIGALKAAGSIRSISFEDDSTIGTLNAIDKMTKTKQGLDP